VARIKDGRQSLEHVAPATFRGSQALRCLYLALLAGLALRLLLPFLGLGKIEKGPLLFVQPVCMLSGPFLCLRQARPAVQLARVTSELFPAAGRLGQVLVDPDPHPVLVEPLPQRGPFADQRLVCDLRASLCQRDQACPSQDLQHLLDCRRVLGTRHQLRQGSTAPGILRLFTELRQA
jgi:hypothetical protein